MGCVQSVFRLNRLAYVVLPNGVSLLTKVTQMELIKALLSIRQPLKGIKYTQEFGRNGLYNTVCSKLEKYLQSESPEAFFFKEKTLGTDFLQFAEDFRSIVKERGFISFDEQVTLCNELFNHYPDLLKIYQNVYKYVMVDEFQDINADQAAFIYSIAEHKNLVVVGDDDQSIYEFRGASNRFMLNFATDFPGAKTIVLQDNFRSVQPLVNAAQALIKNNRQRIAKNIRSNRSGGMKPTIISDTSSKAFSDLISKLHDEGIEYSDIAILSTKNAPLEDLKRQLSVPCVLAKSLLRHDPLFLLIYDCLCLYRNM